MTMESKKVVPDYEDFLEYSDYNPDIMKAQSKLYGSWVGRNCPGNDYDQFLAECFLALAQAIIGE